MRRLRTHPRLREMVRETRLSPSDFILPLFIRHGENQRLPISSMPGHSQLTVDLPAEEVKEIASLGIPAVILFGIPAEKDAVAAMPATTRESWPRRCGRRRARRLARPRPLL